MSNIENLLRSAKPEVPDLPNDFGNLVLNRIEREGILIRSQAKFILNPQIKLSIGLITLLIALVLFSYNFYELRMNGSMELLYFGTRFLGSFFSYLPWDLIIPSLGLTAFSIWMIRKSHFLKRSIAVTAILSYLITGVGGVAMASSGLNESIEAGIEQKKSDWPWLDFFHNQRARKFINHPNFKMGKVDEIKDRFATVITPNDEKITIQLPANFAVEPGQILRISGEGNNTVFTAQRVHICNPNRVMHYFGHMEHHRQMMRHSCCGNNGMMMK